MRLKHLQDNILLKDTKKLATSEREATTRLLYHLKEIDRRKLYCELKYSSLFNYCVHELGYSEASAQRRIVAARMLTTEIEKKINEGDLTLTNIALVNQFVKDPEERVEVLKEVEGLTKRECEKKLFEITGKEDIPKEKQKRVSEDKVQVAIVLSDETIKEIERLKGLLGKNLTMDQLIMYMATEAIKLVEKKKFKQTDKPRASLSPAKVGRAFPTEAKREAYKQNKKCMICGSIHRLNFDHIQPYALGGPSTKENIRMLCFHCNQRERIKAFGSYSDNFG